MIQHAGIKALGSLRMEKGYRDYGHDMDNTDTLLECGLGFTCDFEKEGGFLGMEKVLEQKKQRKADGGLKKRLVQVFVPGDDMLHHGEVLMNGGKMISEIRSSSYGHSLGGSVGLTMLEIPQECPDQVVNKEYIKNGDRVLPNPLARGRPQRRDRVPKGEVGAEEDRAGEHEGGRGDGCDARRRHPGDGRERGGFLGIAGEVMGRDSRVVERGVMRVVGRMRFVGEYEDGRRDG